MTAMQTPQDEIAAIQATLALHAEDIELIKQRLPEITGEVRQALEEQAAEFAIAHARIERELIAIREAQANTDREIAGIKNDITRIDGHIVRIDGHIVRIDGHIVRIDGHIVRIDGEITSIKEMLAVLVSNTDDMIARMDTMSRELTETSSRVGNLTGSRFERRVARNIRGALRRSVGLSQAQVLHRDWGETDDNLIDLLDDADERGAITRQEREDVLDADLIATGANPDGQRAYAVIEIGVTVASADVNRAARRARTMAKATDAQCSALVVGSEIPDAERERAMRAGVTIAAVAIPAD